MYAHDLICTVDGSEVPAPGLWTIPTSHVDLAYDARAGFLRRVRGEPRSVTGCVHVSTDPLRLELQLRIDARSDLGDGPGLGALLGGRYLDEVVLPASVIEFTADAAWRTCGEYELDGIVRPLAVDIQYGAVYPAGDEARAWFVVRASLAEGIAGRLRNGPVDLIADVLAVAPSPA